MTATIELSGIAWNHSRGYTPLAATAQRFQDEFPDVVISWHKRSLKEFGDYPLERLIDRFDLLIIDHPFAGFAAAHDVLVPLDQHLPQAFLADQAANSVGASYPSYVAGDHLWALPVDAAAPIAGWRADLLARHDAAVPTRWEELIALARRGLVAVPAAAVDLQMHLFMFVLVTGESLCQHDDRIASDGAMQVALESLRELVAAAGTVHLERNPIRTWEALSRGDGVAYCPFAYGYSNYGRADFTDHPLSFGGLIAFDGRPLRSVLGGTGLAISRRCTGAALEAAVAYATYVASSACQTGLYTLTGGQPGHRTAWLDPGLNELTNHFFSDTLATLDEAVLRPRYDGYIPFQDHGGEIVHAFLREGGPAQPAIDRLNALYRQSRRPA